MDFTRQPIIETVITAKEGFKLVIRNSKAAGVEEYFVDAVEVVSFGGTFFFRTSEKPKPFLLPATDYEVLEVREARMVLKSVGLDKSIKIGGGKESAKQVEEEKKESAKTEKRREKRKNLRRRKGEKQEEGADKRDDLAEDAEVEEAFTPQQAKSLGEHVVEEKLDLGKRPAHLVPPPTSLISETLEKQYRGNELFKGAFYEKSEEVQEKVDSDQPKELEQSSEEERPKESFEIEIGEISIIPNDEITS